MTMKKSVRVLLVLAASLILLIVAVQSPKKAEIMERADDIIPSQEASFCEGDLVLGLSSEGGFPIYYTLDGSIPTLGSLFYEAPVVMSASEQVQSCVIRARTY